MTFAEVEREIESKKRTYLREQRETASFHYILADLIGHSVARVHSSKNKLPTIAEMYPSLFDAKEIAEEQQKKKDELSAIRFRQFASSFNKRFKGGQDK
jgi:hypothetical protein